MNITIQPRLLSGKVEAIASKSVAHRLLICAAFADQPSILTCQQVNADIEATAGCLNALGANIRRINTEYHVQPAQTIPEKADLYCGESGSTLRFLLPVAGALGVETTFHLEGRLGSRPLSPLWEEMERMGCHLSKPDANSLLCSGKLRNGAYAIDAGVSSQFISGLLFAFSLMEGSSRLTLLGKVESAPYITMTQNALFLFGVATKDFCVSENHKLLSPGRCTVEGDWSNAAFFLCAKAMGNSVIVGNLNYESAQGDKEVVSAIAKLESNCIIDGGNIPDLVPILSVLASQKQGAVFTNIARLRIKESDRVAAIIQLLTALGGNAEADENSLTVFPAKLQSGVVDAVNDHRIAMAAGIAATVASGPVTILGAECVRKSYPSFWEEYRRLGGVL